MTDNRFDSLTRVFRSRRAVNGLVAAMIAGLFGRRDAAAAPCPKGKKRCGGKCIAKRGCCKTADCRPKNSGQVCRKNRCVCPGGKKRCGKRCLLKAAACPPKPDASCSPGGTPGTVALNQRVAQTFIEPNGGRLIAAAIRMRNQSASTTGTYELRLQTVDPATGVPQLATLGVAQRSSNDISDTTLDWVRFDFPSPPRLQPGKRYALAITLTGGTAGWFVDLKETIPCPGGELFITVPMVFFGRFPNAGVAYQTFVKS